MTVELLNTKLPTTLLRKVDCKQGAVRAVRFNGLLSSRPMKSVVWI